MTGEVDPTTGLESEVRVVQPYAATKRYQCPGCNQAIEPGTGHLLVLPHEAPDLRRHWHRPCWQKRRHRRPSGRP